MYLSLSHSEPHLLEVIRQSKNISKSRKCECCGWQRIVSYVCYINSWTDYKKYFGMAKGNVKSMWKKEGREKSQLEYV